MIKAEFFTASSGELLGFSIKGHSGSTEAGNDIICAAVSSAAYMTVNTVTDILHIDARLAVDDGFLRIHIGEEDARSCRSIFAGFKLHMMGLEEQYPKNIKVCYTEV